MNVQTYVYIIKWKLYNNIKPDLPLQSTVHSHASSIQSTILTPVSDIEQQIVLPIPPRRLLSPTFTDVSNKRGMRRQWFGVAFPPELDPKLEELRVNKRGDSMESSLGKSNTAQKLNEMPLV